MLQSLTRQTLGLILMLLLTFVGLLAVTFTLGRLVPNDPVLAIVGPKATQSTYDQVYKELGLDKPLYEQFYLYLKGVSKGDLGSSFLTSNKVLDDIKTYFPATIELATLGIIFGILFGIPLGILAATKANSIFDYLVRFFSIVGYSAPIFWLGYLGILIFYKHLDWVGAPEGRLGVVYAYTVPAVTNFVLIDTLLTGDWGAFKDAISHIILPTALLGWYSLGYISRMTRSFMIEQLQQEYITMAKVKGLSNTKIIWKHALSNAAIPLITVIMLSYATLLEGSVITETVFAWPGIGRYITSSLFSSDMNAVLGGTMVVGMVFVFFNILSDYLYKLADPRVRKGL